MYNALSFVITVFLYYVWALPCHTNGSPYLPISTQDLQEPDPMLGLPIENRHRTLMSGGMTNPCPSVLQVMQTQISTMSEPVSMQLMDEIVGGLRYIFQTKNNLTFPVTGTGNTGMTAILFNLIEPNDKILFGINSAWADRATEIAKRIEANVIELRKDTGEPFTLQELRIAIERERPRVLYLVHAISSTGVLQDLSGVGDRCHEFDCLLVVDMVSSIAAVPVYVDEWKVDAAFANSQKGLGSLVGLAPVTFSQRAYDRYKRRQIPVTSDLLELEFLALTWVPQNESSRFSLASTPLQQFYALREGLSLVVNETLPKRWERVENSSKRLTHNLRSIGVTPNVVLETNQLYSVMTYNLPCDITVRDLTKFALERYELDLSSGYFGNAAEALRVGIFACNAEYEKVDFVYNVLSEGILELRNKTSILNLK